MKKILVLVAVVGLTACEDGPTSCSPYIMTQAVLMNRADAQIDSAVRYTMRERNVEAYKTGWSNTYYGTPICHIAYTSKFNGNRVDGYYYYNPTQNEWDQMFTCKKFGNEYKCNLEPYEPTF